MPTRAELAAERIAPALAGRDVLEAACGSAEFSLAAAELADSVTCIDLDDSRLSPAVYDCENLRFRQMDAAAMRFADESFDTAVLYNAAFHLGDKLDAAVAECLRVLRPGGLLCVISTWSLDRPVLTDALLPLLTARGLRCRLSTDEPFWLVQARKSPSERSRS
ncbi:MAG: class I SAM-dependent methyltransferase [Clostridia bacterium]|nr:class I SAM-dependent methyltransferase [Clostridia bacterium]